MTQDCTVLVNSCDEYADTWYPFFKILKAEWPDRPYPIVLNTESKSFDYEDMKIQTFQLYPPEKKVPWGKRLIETLKHIHTKYVLFLLDDFFLLDQVDQPRIEKCIQWMEESPSIAVFSFWRTHGPNIPSKVYPHFEKRPQDGEYRLNCQAAVWRRERLIEFIKPHESPWDWEAIGSIRSRRYPDEFYSAIEGEPYVFLYDFMHGGAIHRGKWVEEGVKPLFDKYAIDVDVSIRGIEVIQDVNLSLFSKIRGRLRSIIIRIKSLR